MVRNTTQWITTFHSPLSSVAQQRLDKQIDFINYYDVHLHGKLNLRSFRRCRRSTEFLFKIRPATIEFWKIVDLWIRLGVGLSCLKSNLFNSLRLNVGSSKSTNFELVNVFSRSEFVFLFLRPTCWQKMQLGRSPVCCARNGVNFFRNKVSLNEWMNQTSEFNSSTWTWFWGKFAGIINCPLTGI